MIDGAAGFAISSKVVLLTSVLLKVVPLTAALSKIVLLTSALSGSCRLQLHFALYYGRSISHCWHRTVVKGAERSVYADW